MKQRNTLTRLQMAIWGLLLFGILLFVSACSNNSSPGSQPNPGNNGYSVIRLVGEGIQFFHTLP